MKRSIWLMALGLSLVHCATREAEVVKVVEFSEHERASWNGHTEDELLAVWGQPASRSSDGRDGRVLVYDKVRLEETDPGALRPPFLFLGQWPETPLAWPRTPFTTVALHSDVATFWIDGEGVIYRHWIDEKRIEKKLRAIRSKPPVRTRETSAR